MATYQVPGDQMVTVGGFPTGLATPSVPLAVYGKRSVDLIGGSTVSFHDLYSKQSWAIGAVCNKISRQISRLPLKAYKKGEGNQRDRLTSGYLPDLLRTPWPRGGPTHLKQMLSLPVLVHGNGLHAKVRDGRNGPVTRLVPVDWRLAEPEVVGGVIIGWQCRQVGFSEFVEPEDMVHVAFCGLDSPVGVSPLQQLGVTLSIEDAAQRHQQALLRNGATPPSALTLDAKILEYVQTADEQQALVNLARSDLDLIHGGPDQRGKPAVFPPGFTMESIGHTAVEAELIDQRKLAREEVAACYDLAPPLWGILENATLANVEEYNRQLFVSTLAPWLTLIEDTLQAQLIDPEPTLRGGLFVEFDLSDVLRGDLLRRAQAIAIEITNGTLTINEARDLDNRPRFDIPEADKPLIQTNNVGVLGSATPVATPPVSAPTDGDVQDAAAAFMELDGAGQRRVLRGYPTVVDAILGLSEGGQRYSPHMAPAMNGHDSEAR